MTTQEKQIERLEAKVAELQAELAYFEGEMMSGDGVRCECEKVRHVNDCVRSEITDAFYCCKKCMERGEADYQRHQDYLSSIDYAYRTR